MKRILILMAIIASSVFAESVIINDPQETIYVSVSRSSMNRVVFPSKIVSKMYSKEKGLVVKTYGNEAFLKYTPLKEENSQQVAGKPTPAPIEKSVIYHKAKTAEVYFVTEYKTYSIIFKPKKLGPQTIIINDNLAKKKEVINYETKDPYKMTLKKIAEDVHSGAIPYGYEEKKTNERFSGESLVVIKEKVYQGTLYSAIKYRLLNKGTEPISLDERNYISLSTTEPLFISVFYAKQLKDLNPMDEATLVVIQKGEDSNDGY